MKISGTLKTMDNLEMWMQLCSFYRFWKAVQVEWSMKIAQRQRYTREISKSIQWLNSWLHSVPKSSPCGKTPETNSQWFDVVFTKYLLDWIFCLAMSLLPRLVLDMTVRHVCCFCSFFFTPGSCLKFQQLLSILHYT